MVWMSLHARLDSRVLAGWRPLGLTQPQKPFMMNSPTNSKTANASRVLLSADTPGVKANTSGVKANASGVNDPVHKPNSETPPRNSQRMPQHPSQRIHGKHDVVPLELKPKKPLFIHPKIASVIGPLHTVFCTSDKKGKFKIFQKLKIHT